MSRVIVTIGGGSIGKPSPDNTKPIDKEIVKLSGKKKPKFLFIPTASSDDEHYTKVMFQQYTSLGCNTKVLKLITEKPSKRDRAKLVEEADIIYVGGGNTLKMMRLWRRLGVDVMLKKAWKRGAVCCGLSAGSICWYESGHSDSMSFYNPKKWKYIFVNCLGFLKGVHCPHYDSETLGKKRRSDFQKSMQKKSDMGFGVENCCAMVWKDDSYKVIASKKSANAYRVWKERGKIREELIPKTTDFQPIKSLYRE